MGKLCYRSVNVGEKVRLPRETSSVDKWRVSVTGPPAISGRYFCFFAFGEGVTEGRIGGCVRLIVRRWFDWVFVGNIPFGSRIPVTAPTATTLHTNIRREFQNRRSPDTTYVSPLYEEHRKQHSLLSVAHSLKEAIPTTEAIRFERRAAVVRHTATLDTGELIGSGG